MATATGRSRQDAAEADPEATSQVTDPARRAGPWTEAIQTFTAIGQPARALEL